jgi:hypothetical protein
VRGAFFGSSKAQFKFKTIEILFSTLSCYASTNYCIVAACQVNESPDEGYHEDDTGSENL